VWDWAGNLGRAGWRRIQNTLNRLKCSNPPLDEDGLCGRLTKQALREFQFRKGLVQDMVFGPMTWAAWAAEAFKDESKESAEPVKPEDWTDPEAAGRPGTVTESGWTAEGFDKVQTVETVTAAKVGPEPELKVGRTRKLPKPS